MSTPYDHANSNVSLIISLKGWFNSLYGIYDNLIAKLTFLNIISQLF